MMAKLIVTGKNREQALARANRALQEFVIEGVATVLPFHQLIVKNPDFTDKNSFGVHTRWIETDFAEPLSMAMRGKSEPVKINRYMIELDGKRVELGLPDNFLQLLGGLSVAAPQEQGEKQQETTEGDLCAPIPGAIRTWLVEDGADVDAGATVAIMEAMKMETAIVAPCSGKIKIIKQAGENQQAGEIIGRIVVA